MLRSHTLGLLLAVTALGCGLETSNDPLSEGQEADAALTSPKKLLNKTIAAMGGSYAINAAKALSISAKGDTREQFQASSPTADPIKASHYEYTVLKDLTKGQSRWQWDLSTTFFFP